MSITNNQSEIPTIMTAEEKENLRQSLVRDIKFDFLGLFVSEVAYMGNTDRCMARIADGMDRGLRDYAVARLPRGAMERAIELHETIIIGFIRFSSGVNVPAALVEQIVEYTRVPLFRIEPRPYTPSTPSSSEELDIE